MPGVRGKCGSEWHFNDVDPVIPCGHSVSFIQLTEQLECYRTFCSRIYDGNIQFSSLEQTQIFSFNSWNIVGPKIIFWKKEFKSTMDQYLQARCLVHRNRLTCRRCSYACLMRLLLTELCDLVTWRRFLICIDHMLWNMRWQKMQNWDACGK